MKVEWKAEGVRDQKKGDIHHLSLLFANELVSDPINSISDRGFYIFRIPENILKLFLTLE
jgi:hypothetical protein